MENLFSLKQDDNILYETKLHWISYVGPFISVLISIPAVIILSIMFLSFLRGYEIGYMIMIIGFIMGSIFLPLFIKGIVKLISNRYTHIYVTSKSLTFKTGVFSQNINDISLNKYEGMNLQQSFLGRQLNYGTLIITTGGATQSYKIENPLGLRQHILEQINK